MSRVAVIGGGAAGMMAAVTAARDGHEVSLYEKNEKLGKKLYITGKGRCNLTNNCDEETLLRAVCSNRKFLYSAFYGFNSQETIRFFEEAGLNTKTERGGRVFPVSDHSSDVTAALISQLRKNGVKIYLNEAVTEIVYEDSAGIMDGNRYGDSAGIMDGSGMDADAASRGSEAFAGGDGQRRTGLGSFPVRLPEAFAGGDGQRRNPIQKGSSGTETCAGGKQSETNKRNGYLRHVSGLKLASGRSVDADAVIAATGGLSYPSTGSTGDGYRFAREAGHSVTECSPSLVPMETEGEWARLLQGLSLRNVEVTILDGKKELYREFGEMMFTHFGVTGPLILTASSVVQRRLREHPLLLYIDLKPALGGEQLDLRVLREFDAGRNRQFKNILGSLFPAKLIPVMISRCGIPADKPVHEISREERRNLIVLTKHFPLTLTGLRGYNEAVITRGGVSVREIDPATMESKKVRGLYFAGEVLDLDALTGGFNLQIAWSTGYAAGRGVRG